MNNSDLSIQIVDKEDLLAKVYQAILSWDAPVDTQQENADTRVVCLEGVSINA